MPKTVALGNHFKKPIADQVAAGFYNDNSEVVRAGLRLLEEHELKLRELRAHIDQVGTAYADGRYTVVADPSAAAADIIARGRRRAQSTSPAITIPQDCGR